MFTANDEDFPIKLESYLLMKFAQFKKVIQYFHKLKFTILSQIEIICFDQALRAIKLNLKSDKDCLKSTKLSILKLQSFTFKTSSLIMEGLTMAIIDRPKLNANI